MNVSFSIPDRFIEGLTKWSKTAPWQFFVTMLAIEVSILSTITAYFYDIIVAYGDAESHLNIAKRVVSSITPGLAQLGGIWLPLPHALMLPFVWFDPLWQTGLAGSIVSGMAFIVSSIYLYKFTYLLTKHKLASFVAFLAFASNPNILYAQSTPMTEMLLIMFFVLSTYHFTKFVLDRDDYYSLLAAAFFGFCATLSRYDGWFLVLFEAAAIVGLYFPWKKRTYKEMEGKVILFATLAFIGIGLWMLWDYLILGDPLYFTNSEFSAKSQQSEWLARGELPAHNNIWTAFIYYFVTAMTNAGILVYFAAIPGLYYYLKEKVELKRFLITAVLMVPFVFNVFTMYVGQSVVFIPSLTPTTFEWTLFNVRYGLMMVSVVSFFFAYAFYRSGYGARVLLISLLLFQFVLYSVGFSPIITLDDGVKGLSNQKVDYSELWMREHYDGGYVLLDDYARSISITRTKIPMQHIIYLGNKPYWDLALENPQNYVRWIIMQENDTVWKAIFDNEANQKDLYAHYEKAYTSPNVLIFKRMSKFETSFTP